MFKRILGIRAIVAVFVAFGASLLLIDVLADDGPSNTGDRFQRIDAYIQDQMDDSRIPGIALAIVEGNRVAHARGFGNDGRGNPITVETPFWIGSNTKSITALATMQLVEAGKIDLDAPVQRYLPDFHVADAEASARITVRHLLNQTSGISKADSLKTVAAGKDQTLAEAVADMRDLELNRPVGESFEYANLNSVVLGLLIERVTGIPWQDYVQANIFDPLGMTRTYTSLADAKANGLTETHRYAFGFPFASEPKYQTALLPTGYVYSTAEDMARYLTMYLQGGILDGTRVLSEAGVAQMLTGATNERTFQLQSHKFTARYGAGWFVGPFGAAQDARWHQGSLPQFTAWMVILPDTQQAAIVLINAGNQFEVAGANGAWSRIPQGIVNILRGEAAPTGISVTRFFIVFNTAAVVIFGVQVWSLTRVWRTAAVRPSRSWASVWALTPLVWELGLASFVLLVAYPSMAGGLGWRATFAFLPDLTIVVAAVSGLWLLTGTVRLAKLAKAAVRNRDAASRSLSTGSITPSPTAGN